MSEHEISGNPYVKHLWQRDVRYRDGDVVVCLSSMIEAILGPSGRMISASKTDYRSRYPDHDVMFNACLFAADEPGGGEAVEVWFGDIDLTMEREALQRAADAAGRRLILTPEQPFRFKGLAEGMLSSAARGVQMFDPR